MPHLIWPLSSRTYNTASAVLVNTIRENNLSQLVDFPTRFRNQQTPSLLDLVLVNDPDTVSGIEQHPPLGKSDHIILHSRLQLLFPPTNDKFIKTLKITNYRRLDGLVEAVDWVSLLQPAADVELMWSIFAETLQGLVDNCTSTSRTTFIPLKPWINANILKLIRHKKSLWQRYTRRKEQRDYDAHRSFSNFLSSTIANAKRDYELKLTRSNDRKGFYKYVRSTLNTKVEVPLVYDRSGRPCSDPEESANILADSFFFFFHPRNWFTSRDNHPSSFS